MLKITNINCLTSLIFLSQIISKVFEDSASKLNFLRAIFIALFSFLLASSIDFQADLETKVGLDALFNIRGKRPAPAEVVVVAMDEASEARLAVGQDLTRWREFHAKLIHALQRQGVALIIFDLQFLASNPAVDSAFSVAMLGAGNVLVTECVQKFRRGDEDFFGRDECSENNKAPIVVKENLLEEQLSEQLIAMRSIPPTPVLEKSVLDHAPFYLVNDAENAAIREAWTFFDALADLPSLPVLTWFYYLKHTGSSAATDFPNTKYSTWLTTQRRACLSSPQQFLKSTPEKTNLQIKIDAVICQGDSQYIDYFGPPKTLRMVSYSDVIEGKVSDLKSKVVFVGKANRKYSPGKTDFFQTPFTNAQTGKMAGVEIMATQFANLNEGRFVESVSHRWLILLTFGIVISLLLTAYNGLLGIAVSLLVGSFYAGIAQWSFNRSGLWLPVAVPLLIQLPLTWLLALIWSRRDLLNERKRIVAFVHQVFPQWLSFLPASPGQWYPEKSVAQLASERDVYGLCLATDIEGYTSVAAQHTAHEMWELLNAYYQALGHPVSSHDGIIADITGDSMMAVWIDLPEDSRRLSACLAALEMEQAVERFNATSSKSLLLTRIGLHEGEITLGSLDVSKGGNYRAIGDTVNIASRIQGVNKFLGTRILASKTITANLPEIVCRAVGAYRLLGRKEPVELVEIVGLETDVNDAQYAIFKKFAYGLNAFQQGKWKKAVIIFEGLLKFEGDDEPTRFLLNLALAYCKNPPATWDGVVTLYEK